MYTTAASALLQHFNSSGQQNSNVSYMCNFKFSNSHIEKIKTGEINNILIYPIYPNIIFSTRNQFSEKLELF